MTFSFESKIESMGYNLDLFEESTVEVFKRSLAGLAKAAQAEWIRIAQERLRSSREMYVDGLRRADSFSVTSLDGEKAYAISLIGRMPNAIELGMSPFDMKGVRPGWLGGGKAKTAKDGTKYITVPMRHSTSSDARLAYTGKAAMADLKTELKKTVASYGLDRMVRTASGQVVTGPVKRVPKDPDVHRYLQGLTRIQTATGGMTKSGMQRGSSTLMTFRRMSEKSSPESWMHPGLEARNILGDVEKWVDTEASRIIESILGVA